jgi:hypothetical protein
MSGVDYNFDLCNNTERSVARDGFNQDVGLGENCLKRKGTEDHGNVSATVARSP